jgi:SWI/SNF-related matrix-associated actin-dependent regulator of chromatin subfamily A member 5
VSKSERWNARAKGFVLTNLSSNKVRAQQAKGESNECVIKLLVIRIIKQCNLGWSSIDAIIRRGEEHTPELNTKYEGLNLEDLSGFKSDALVQQWERGGFQA